MILNLLRSLANHNARIVGTSRDPETMTDAALGAYRVSNLSLGRAEGQLRFRVRRERLATPWLDYWYLSPDELENVSAPSGWRMTHTEALDFGGYLSVLEFDGR
jgi:hypothetical protein